MATIIFSVTTVPEDAAEGTIIGLVSVSGGVPGETFAFILDDPSFAIEESNGVHHLVVRPGAEFDYENGQPTFSFTIRATSTNGNTTVDDQPVVLNVTDVNERPDFELDDRDVHEGALPGTIVYTLDANDPDGDVVSYQLSEESEDIFDLIDNKDGTWSVVVDKSVQWLELESDQFTVRVTHGSETYEEMFDLNISENLEPEIDFQAVEVSQAPQGGTLVGVLSASDPEGHDITYTLTDESEDLFHLVRNANGTWSVFVDADETLDYTRDEHKSFDVLASDHFNTVEYTGYLTFINQAPTLSFTSVAVKEGAAVDTLVGKLLAKDPDGDDVTYTLSPESERLFELLDNEEGGCDIVVRDGVVLDYENPSHRWVKVSIFDGTARKEETFTIDLLDTVDTVIGTQRKDTLKGQPGSDVIKGLGGDDMLIGDAGNDTLYGGAGKDILTGNDGQDVFVFDTKPSGKANVDRLTDFNAKDDSIWLENKVFTKLGKAGSLTMPAQLSKSSFAIDRAKDKNDYLIYSKKTGVLSYDADGSGSKPAIEIAQLKKGLGLSFKDLFVI